MTRFDDFEVLTVTEDAYSVGDRIVVEKLGGPSRTLVVVCVANDYIGKTLLCRRETRWERAAGAWREFWARWRVLTWWGRWQWLARRGGR